MKSILLTVTLAAAALFVVASPAEAQTRFHFSVGSGYHSGHHHGGHHRGGHGYHHSSRHSGIAHPNHYARGGGHCAPVVVVRTHEINRCRRPVTGYHPCGRPYTYWVTTVTYRDYYSNGSFRDYTRTFS